VEFLCHVDGSRLDPGIHERIPCERRASQARTERAKSNGALTIDGTTFDSPIESAEDGGPKAYLAVTSGPAEPAVVDLPRGAEVSIGRSRSSGLRVDHGAVSRIHATLRWDGGGTVTLVDYGSRNGTLVDGQRVRGTMVVGSGAEIRVGDALVVLVVGGSAGVSSTESAGWPVEETGVLARDPLMLKALALAERAARSDSTVLLTGETGAGKEVVAKRIHRTSTRRDGPFVAINCGAISDNIAEATLFGHEKGAFTGASERRAGVFEAAHGGTLFLDEVGELSQSSQVRLLRALEARVITRVGGVEEVPVDVRLIAATNRDLEEASRVGQFRDDLRYRLDVVRIVVPPLRERVDDIVPLAARFLAELAPNRVMSLAPDAVASLREHHWPGNVRELRNVIERAVAISESDLVRSGDLGDLRGVSTGRAAGGGLQYKVDDAERDAIVAALKTCDGNKTHAAKRLGISRRALIYRMEKLGLKAPPPSQRS